MVGRATSARAVDALKAEGRHAIGDGLYLQITPAGRSWLFRYTGPSGKRREMGLGAYPGTTLAEARQGLADARKVLRLGECPLDRRNRSTAALRAEKRMVCFRDAAEAYIDAHKAGWKNPKHAAQWPATLEAYAYPVLSKLPVDAITQAHVLEVLRPIWTSKPETAARVRGRLELVLDAAKAAGQRQGENPARWRGHLDKLLPARNKVRVPKHHAALPYRAIPAFLAALRAETGMAARCLELVILTATRTGEAIGARWEEIDLDDAVWIIPAERMKAGREHRVPLSNPALALLRTLAEAGRDGFVFPGGRAGKPLSNMAMAMLLKRMEQPAVTVHGFRSTFRDWVAELTSHPHEIAEAALAHVVRDKVVAAYQRGDLLARRRVLMEDWAAFCAGQASGNVVRMRA